MTDVFLIGVLAGVFTFGFFIAAFLDGFRLKKGLGRNGPRRGRKIARLIVSRIFKTDAVNPRVKPKGFGNPV